MIGLHDKLRKNMRALTQIAIPEPKGSELENFDRLASMLMRVKPKKKNLQAS